MENYWSLVSCEFLNPWLDPSLRKKVLFLGGLPVDCPYEELFSFLRQFSEVLWLRIEVDSFTGISKGFAYCILADTGYPKILAKSIYYIRGIPVGVQLWKDPATYLSHKFSEMERKVFIKRIPPQLQERDLSDYFAKFGTVELCEIKKSHLDHSSRGIGFVVFSSSEEAGKCLLKRNHFVCGLKVECHKCKDRKKFSVPPETDSAETGPGASRNSRLEAAGHKKRPAKKASRCGVARLDRETSAEPEQIQAAHALIPADELFEACAESAESSFTAVDRDATEEGLPSQGVLLSLKHLIDEC